jgi:protein-histidine pros-kinase
MVIVGRDGKITLVNSQAERLFGYQRAQLLGQPVELLIPERFRGKHPGHRGGFFDASSPVAQAGTQRVALSRSQRPFPDHFARSPFVVS